MGRKKLHAHSVYHHRFCCFRFFHAFINEVNVLGKFSNINDKLVRAPPAM